MATLVETTVPLYRCG